MLTDIKLSKDQLPKIIQLDKFLGKKLGNIMGNLGKKALIDFVALSAEDVLPKLATKANSPILEKFGEKKVNKDLQEQETDSLC